MSRNEDFLYLLIAFYIVVSLVVVFALQNQLSSKTAPLVATVDTGLYEGQGNLTFGCALWQPLSVRPYDEETKGVRPLADFYLEGSNEEAVLIYARSDGIVIVSGLRCGISVDWTRFPREGN